MKTLTLQVRPLTWRILSSLAKRGLVRPLVPTASVVRCRSAGGAVGKIYSSNPRWGTHKLISVRCTTGRVRLNSHGDNEEFILIHPQARSFSPMYMIIGLHKHSVIERKARSQELTEHDFMAFELVYNNPSLSIFTMLKDTVHFEISSRTRKQAPIFFVTEPSRLKLHMLKVPAYRLEVSVKGSRGL
jgi:hypothetical protein